jgi:hypothetical protein
MRDAAKERLLEPMKMEVLPVVELLEVVEVLVVLPRLLMKALHLRRVLQVALVEVLVVALLLLQVVTTRRLPL